MEELLVDVVRLALLELDVIGTIVLLLFDLGVLCVEMVPAEVNEEVLVRIKEVV